MTENTKNILIFCAAFGAVFMWRRKANAAERTQDAMLKKQDEAFQVKTAEEIVAEQDAGFQVTAAEILAEQDAAFAGEGTFGVAGFHDDVSGIIGGSVMDYRYAVDGAYAQCDRVTC